MGNVFDVRTIRIGASVFMVSSNSMFTAEQLYDTFCNRGPEIDFVFLIKNPPIIIGGQNLFDGISGEHGQTTKG